MESYYKIQPEHPLYLRASKREAASWGREQVRTLRKKRPRDHPIIKAYLAQLISNDDKETDWVEWFLKNADNYDSALSLGCGSGHFEEELIKAGIFKKIEMVDISEDALNSFKEKAKDLNSKTVITTNQADLNFIELYENKYDCILAHTSLHHIINLEHLLEQVRKALVPKGIFLVHDFIGPSEWQWSYNTLQEINRALDLSRGRYPQLKIHQVKRPDINKVKAFSPFESIRSDEILELLRTGFEPQLEILTDRLLHVILNFGAEMENWKDKDLQKWLSEMVEWEDSLKNGCELPPYTLWGVYYPKPEPIPETTRWSEAELNEKIKISKFSLKAAMADFIDRLPWRDSLVTKWMRMKRKHGWY